MVGRPGCFAVSLLFPCLVLTLCSLMNPDKTAPQFSQYLSCKVEGSISPYRSSSGEWCHHFVAAVLCSGPYANRDNEQAGLGRGLAKLGAGTLCDCAGPAAAVLRAGCRHGLWGGSRDAAVGTACERRVGLEAVTGTIALVGMAATSGRGALGSQRCATPGRVLIPERCWAIPGPEPGRTPARGQAHADLGTAAFSPGGRRGGGASPRAGRGLPGDPGPAPAPLPRTSSGRHLGRADTVIAPMHAAVPPPPRRRGRGAAMLRPCAADKPRGAWGAQSSGRAGASSSLPPPEGKISTRGRERRRGGRGDTPRRLTPPGPARPAPAPSALHKSIGAGRSEDITTYYLPPERAGDLRAEISRRGDGICLLLCCLPLPPGSSEGNGEGLASRAGRGREEVAAERRWWLRHTTLNTAQRSRECRVWVSGGTGWRSPGLGWHRGRGNVTAPVFHARAPPSYSWGYFSEGS